MKNPQHPNKPQETGNLMVAIALSMLVIFGWQMFVDAPKKEQERIAAEQAAQTAIAPAPETAKPAPPRSRAEVLAEGQRITIQTPDLHGSFSLTGDRLDDLSLARYHETADKTSPEITLLSPSGTETPYYAEFGWRADNGLAVPTQTSVWTASSKTLTPEQPVTLTWSNGQGLTFERKIEVDANYMFTVTQSVRNDSAMAVTLHPYGLVSRTAPPETAADYISNDGAIGVFNGTLAQDKYKAISDKGTLARATTGGWFGFTDKYWLVALAPDQSQPVDVRIINAKQVADNRFQTDFSGAALTVAPGSSSSVITHLFAGAKEVRALDGYTKTLGIPNLDLAIDFGWLYFLTKPFFYALDILAHLFGNFGFAILAFTVCVKLLLFPLADKSYVSMAKMKLLTPKIKEIREAYAKDPQRLSKEMMELYKNEGVHPLSGCWPILIQIPIFFALYKVLYVSIEMRHVPFTWVADLSSADPTNLFTLFGYLPWDAPSILHIGAWPLMMAVTMALQMRMNPPPSDPAQQMIFRLMPWIFMYSMASFPAGLVMYWSWSNFLSIIQQYVIMRRMHVRTFE